MGGAFLKWRKGFLVKLLCFDNQEILFENYDDELVLLDLRGGIYYTVDRVGADCMLLLLSLPTAEQARSAMLARFDVTDSDLDAAVENLSRELLGFGLVKPRDDGAPGMAFAFEPAARQAFSAPKVEQFRDIEDVLKFDPVHDVTGEGWPSLKDGVSA
jgi:hypothetical protein